MEEFNDSARVGINASQVWAFVQIAELAYICQVSEIVRPTVLDRNDMLDVKRVHVVVLM